MSAETFVFTQLQSGALPTELSEANPPTCLHYLILINRKGQKSHPQAAPKARAFQGLKPSEIYNGWFKKRGRKIATFASVARVAVKRGKRRLATGEVKGWDLQALQDQRWVDHRHMMQHSLT